jgi:acyl-CoA reductase-like NAD-dependent aldehyde dehydrogenase
MAITQSIDRAAPDHLFIGGEWVPARAGAVFATTNPADGERIAEVAEGRAADVDAAVAAARDALQSKQWAGMDAADRGNLLWKVADALEARREALMSIEAVDNGKPLREAQFDLQEAIDAFRYYAGWTTKLEGETIPVRGNVLNYTVREPVGVVGAIIPWNFPLEMAAWKVAPALACGNTVVLKPAEQTPLTALELAHIAADVGIPAGVLNVVPGFGETAGAALVRHPGVDKIAFTGSTAVGKIIMREAAETLKRVSLELGGKSPTSSWRTPISMRPRAALSLRSSTTPGRLVRPGHASLCTGQYAKSLSAGSSSARARWSQANRSIPGDAWVRSFRRSSCSECWDTSSVAGAKGRNS